MFDIGFSEMIVIAVIALVVLGPEKLPRVARTAGHLLGRMQRYVNDVKADINREIELDELRKLQQEMQKTATSIEQSVKGQIDSVQSEFQQIGDSTQKALSDATSLVHDPIADAFADPPPVQPAPASAPVTAEQLPPLTEPPVEPVTARVETAQLELGLDDTLPRPKAPPPTAVLVNSAPPTAVLGNAAPSAAAPASTVASAPAKV
jgi:sec-independent protein translocase protein TatB